MFSLQNVERCKETFAPGVLASIMNLNIDHDLRRVINYIVGTFVDMGITGSTTTSMMQLVLPMIPSVDGPFVADSCSASSDAGSQDIKSFDTQTFDAVFKGYAAMNVVSFLLLMMERHIMQRIRPVKNAAIAYCRGVQCVIQILVARLQLVIISTARRRYRVRPI